MGNGWRNEGRGEGEKGRGRSEVTLPGRGLAGRQTFEDLVLANEAFCFQPF